ncbi:MAG TPA: bifunctional UDP-N-acetylglucosamine diphosphorylase/glucosamine-1-phosphate N-acetyltransferase GlmU, partial [Thermoanaerobaculia bacterium]|nr:bifunctional UDP-N-acetylglucosamine diphosphorylase/glucosamine-1-phosphate N-acetyltransferase GlmU [Thermoanaerobaculia bacterium]
MTGETVVVVLAAGKGVRMNSALPKVLHPAAGRPLFEHVLRIARAVLAETNGGRLVVVVGAGREAVVEFVERAAPGAIVAVQDPPRGTGDAVRAAAPHFGEASRVVVLSGDVPLLRPATVTRLLAELDAHRDTPVAFLTAVLPDPPPYGRVLRDAHGVVVAVVEERDATDEEKRIREVNAGVYAFDRRFLEGALARLEPTNAQGEYYLTDVLAMAVESGRPAHALVADDPDEMLGVNSRAELARVDALLRARVAQAAMDAGATLIRPETITLDEEAVLAPECVVEPFVSLFGTTRVGAGSRIGQGCVVRDSVIGANVTLNPYCVMEGSLVGDGAVVGPFARLRKGSDLGEGVHIGNFVETKKAVLRKGVKANHLTYLGDTEIGEGTNVGAGVITCNYDGFSKNKTTIGRNVFVGSHVQLVAPVTVGDGAIVGAGTTVTEDIPPDALAISRSPQTTKPGGGAAYRERKKSGKKK